MSDYNVEFDIDYEKIVREIKAKSYPKNTRVLMCGGEMSS